MAEMSEQPKGDQASQFVYRLYDINTRPSSAQDPLQVGTFYAENLRTAEAETKGRRLGRSEADCTVSSTAYESRANLDRERNDEVIREAILHELNVLHGAPGTTIFAHC